MNEKQKKFLEACDDVEIDMYGDKYGNLEVDLVCIDAADCRYIVKLALELLADEPEKSLRDYTLAELAALVHDMAKEKGWWDSKREWPEIACLIHSEISEAVECYRRGEMAMHVVDGKPEGLAVELADVVIRCLDYLAELAPPSYFAFSLTTSKAMIEAGTGVERYPDTMLACLYDAHRVLGLDSLTSSARAAICMERVFYTARRFSLDLPAAIEAKIHYNATRPYRHGGKKA